MWQEMLNEVAHRHRFKLLGALSGLVLALLVIRFGPWWTLFIVLCTGAGYWIGKRIDDEPESLRELAERLIPRGGQR